MSFTKFLGASAAGRLPLYSMIGRPQTVMPKIQPYNTQILARRWLSDGERSAIDQAVASAPVVLFMKGTPEAPACGFSRASIQILGLQGVDPNKFHAFNVLEDDQLRQGIKEYSSWPTIPQLYLDKEFIGGCDILIQMHQSGELADLFEKAGVLVPEDPAQQHQQDAKSNE